jgi:hypothetical protein
MPNVKPGLGTVRCRICKHIIPQKAGRGRVKEIHEQCGQYESALNRIIRFVSDEVVWADEGALKAQRGDIQTILNQHCDKRTARISELMEGNNGQ